MLEILNLACAVGSGLMAGVFFAFSVSVMRALRSVPGPCGIAVMQSINVAIINPMFLSVFLGTAGACVLVAGLSIAQAATVTWPHIAGSALYLIGVLLVTMRFNVPLNNALARVSPESPEGEKLWRTYLSQWTAWNHVRTIASLGALLSFALAR